MYPNGCEIPVFITHKEHAMWTPIGNYEVTVDSEQFYIFPTNKRDETFRVSIDRTCFHLKHNKAGLVTFKRFKHQGRWKWNDSRSKGACSESHVIREVARMLFQKDESQAKAWLISGLTK